MLSGVPDDVVPFAGEPAGAGLAGSALAAFLADFPAADFDDFPDLAAFGLAALALADAGLVVPALAALAFGVAALDAAGLAAPAFGVAALPLSARAALGLAAPGLAALGPAAPGLARRP